MRISDWSSDVCSSDLGAVAAEGQQRRPDRAVRPGGAAGVLLPALAPGGARPAPRRRGGALRPAGRLFAGRPALRQAHAVRQPLRSEEHKSELQSLMRSSYAVFCLKKKNKKQLKSIKGRK